MRAESLNINRLCLGSGMKSYCTLLHPTRPHAEHAAPKKDGRRLAITKPAGKFDRPFVSTGGTRHDTVPKPHTHTETNRDRDRDTLTDTQTHTYTHTHTYPKPCPSCQPIILSILAPLSCQSVSVTAVSTLALHSK